MEQKVFQYQNFRMEYVVWGDGPAALLAFHGYGRNHRDFVRFTEPFKQTFTIYGIDLFFHEGSHIGDRRADENPLKPAEFRNIFNSFLSQIGADRVWLMGYSLGGRISLKLAEVLPDKVSGLYLFAPDGLIKSRWYVFLSHYAAGRMVFRFFRKHNYLFFRVLNAARKAGLISRKLHHFVASQVATPEMQEKVYNVWTFFRLIEPDFIRLEHAVNSGNITLDLFFGKYDKIIPAKNARRLSRHVPDARIQILDTGHAMLTAETGKKIAEEGLLQLPTGNEKSASCAL